MGNTHPPEEFRNNHDLDYTYCPMDLNMSSHVNHIPRLSPSWFLLQVLHIAPAVRRRRIEAIHQRNLSAINEKDCEVLDMPPKLSVRVAKEDIY